VPALGCVLPRPVAVVLALCAIAGATSAAESLPGSGRYDARLCVTLGAAQPSCGPAELDWQTTGGRGRARVAIADLNYRLAVHSSQVEVVLMHGAMQVDEFVAPFEWQGADTLHFADAQKNARYELRFGARLTRPAR
jgi:hypothetical protein